MPYVELHDSAPDHPKILKLARRLGIDEVQALGHMAALWAWTLRMAPDGNLTAYDHESIEIGAKWRGEEGAFVRAALEVHLLDDGPRVHDWDYFCGSLKSAARAREWREKRGANKTERPRTVGDVTEPSRTGTNEQTNERPNKRTAEVSSVAPLPEPHHLDHHLTSLLDWWRWEPSAPDWCPAPRRTARLVERWPALVAAVAPDLTAAAPDLQERLRRYVIAAWESAWVSERRLSGAWLLGTDARAASAGELEQRVANILDGVGAEVVPLPDRRARGPSGFELAAEVAAEMEADFAAAEEAARRG